MKAEGTNCWKKEQEKAQQFAALEITEQCNNWHLKLLAYNNDLKVCFILNLAQAVVWTVPKEQLQTTPA